MSSDENITSTPLDIYLGGLQGTHLVVIVALSALTRCIPLLFGQILTLRGSHSVEKLGMYMHTCRLYTAQSSQGLVYTGVRKFERTEQRQHLYFHPHNGTNSNNRLENSHFSTQVPACKEWHKEARMAPLGRLSNIKVRRFQWIDFHFALGMHFLTL